MAMKTLSIATPALVAASNNKVVFELAQISQGGSITNDNESSDKNMKEQVCRRKINDSASSSTSHKGNNELSYLISKGLEIEFVEDDNVQVADNTVGGNKHDLCSPRGPFDFDRSTGNCQANSNTKEGKDDQLLEGSDADLPISLPSLKSPPTCRRLSSKVRREHDGEQRPVIPFVLQREISELDVNLSSSFDDDDASDEKQQHEEYKKLLYGDDDDDESKSSSWSLNSSFADVRSESGEDTYFSQSFDYETAASSSCGGAGTTTPTAATVVMKNTNTNRRYYFFNNDYSRSQSSYEEQQQQCHHHRRKRSTSSTNSSFVEDVFEQQKFSSSPTGESKKYLLTPLEALRWFDEDDDDNRIVINSPDCTYLKERKDYTFVESRDGGEENVYSIRFSCSTTDESLSSVSTGGAGGEHRKNNLSQHSWFSAVDEVIHEHENEDDYDDEKDVINDIKSSLIYVTRSSSSSSSSGDEEEKQQDIFSSCRTSIPDYDQTNNMSTVLLPKDDNNIKDKHDDIGSDDDTESHLNGIELEDDDDEVLSYSTAASSILLYDDDVDDEYYYGDEDHFDPSKHRRNTITNLGGKKKKHLLPPTSSTNKQRPWSAPSRVDTTAKKNLNDLDLLKGGRRGRNNRRNIFQCLFCPSSVV